MTRNTIGSALSDCQAWKFGMTTHKSPSPHSLSCIQRSMMPNHVCRPRSARGIVVSLPSRQALQQRDESMSPSPSLQRVYSAPSIIPLQDTKLNAYHVHNHCCVPKLNDWLAYSVLECNSRSSPSLP